MPELPDLAILADALDTSLSGRRLSSASVAQPLVLRGTSGELAGFEGQRLLQVGRRGKFLLFNFERERMMINPMLTGRLGLAPPGNRPLPQTAATFDFTPLDGQWTSPVSARPSWPGPADWLPPDKDPAQLRYRDATRMGKIYLLPAGVERPVAGWDEQGPDADSPELTLDQWRSRIARHSGELKNLLRNQQFVAGIGNAYSDEILWAARLAPFRSRKTLAADEVDSLYQATREVLSWAIGQLHELVPPRLEVEQRKFLRVHGRGGGECPRCGGTISEVKSGGFVTNWCRHCQR